MQNWTDSRGNHHAGRIPAHVSCIVGAIGLELTVKLIMELGGAALNFGAKRSDSNSRLVTCLGQEAARALAEKLTNKTSRTMRIPVASKFIARHLRGQGLSGQEIARILHRSDVSVREYLRPDGVNIKKTLRQADRYLRAARDLRESFDENDVSSLSAGPTPHLLSGKKP